MNAARDRADPALDGKVVGPRGADAVAGGAGEGERGVRGGVVGARGVGDWVVLVAKNIVAKKK